MSEPTLMTASSVGSLVRGILSERGKVVGTVRHVFDSTVYIEASGAMVILSRYRWRSPFTINLSGYDGSLTPLSKLFTPSEEVYMDSRALSNGRSIVRLDRAREYSHLPYRGTKTAGNLRERLDFLSKAVGVIASGIRDTSTPYLHSKLCGYMKSGSILTGEAIESLIGLGEGFTPSGDDIYVGLISALAYAETRLKGIKGLTLGWLSGIAPKFSEALHKTTWASRMYITYAMRGLLDESVELLLRSFFFGGDGELYESLLNVVRRGHESGTYIAVGTVIGLSLLLSDLIDFRLDDRLCSLLV